MWAIVEDCFESTMLKLVGYEASLANIDYDINEVEDCAIKVSIQGFASKIFLFAEMFIDCLLEYANKEFEQS
jgi:secreted Zn-dependent insulinase-like peptidase